MSELDTLKILREYHNIAVVGLSPNPSRPSYQVSDYMLRANYNIIPVNPNYKKVLGQVCFASLRDIPEPVEVVDVFRNSAHILEVVEEAIAIGAKVIWLQLGIHNQAAVERARSAGLIVVEERCIKVEHSRHRAALLAG